MKYTGSFFYMSLATYLADKLAYLMPELQLKQYKLSEPLDYHATLDLLKNGEIDFFIWPADDFPGAVSEEFDYFVYDAKALVFSKGNQVLIQFRQALVFPVNFVGAGPGEPEWITLEAMENLKNCDVCFYDALVNPQILNHLSSETERKYVGKRGDSKSFDQSELKELIFDAVRNGKKVLRLKGGDAGILGRIQDEVDLLIEYGLSWSITPGITAAQALAPCTGTYLTSRGVSDRVILTTARQAGGGLSQLMHFERATLVIYMGILSIKKICSQLRDAGYPEDLPAMLAMNLGRSDCKELRGDLSNIADLAEKSKLRPPGLIVFGDTAGLKSYPEFSPLLGRRVLLIGSDEKARVEEAGFLRRAGARPLSISSIKSFKDRDMRFPEYDDVIFLDPRSVYDFHGIRPELEADVKYLAKNEETTATFDLLFNKEIPFSEHGLSAGRMLRRILSREYFNALPTQ